jgi:hypothetical protein
MVMKSHMVKFHGFFAVVATLALGGFCMAETPTSAPATASDVGLLFHASFDKGLKADTAGGNPDPKVKGNVQYDTGVRGKAVIGGDSFVTNLEYQNKGNFQIEKGTVSFWIKPIDWLGDKGKAQIFNLFMQGNGDARGYFGIEMARFGQPEPNLLFYSVNYPNREKAFINDGNSVNWTNDQWHQVVMTWDERQVKLYVDGEVSGTAQLTAPFTPADLHSTTFAFLAGGEEHTALDEVRIWDHPLEPAEILSRYKEEKP